MAYPSKKKIRKWLELTDHNLMEKIFGKRAMKEIDKIVDSKSESTEKQTLNKTMKES